MSPIDPKFTLALANEHLYSVPYKQVDARWLRLYIQASVAHARSLEAEEAIRVLDRAIIVAGPSDEIFDLIREKQAHLSLPALSWAGSSRITEEVGKGVSSELVIAKQRIPRLGLEEGTSHRDAGEKGPYITRTGIDWPALHKWHDAKYLLSVAGPGRHVPVEVGRSYDEDGWTQRIVPFVDFLSRAWGGQKLSGGRGQGPKARTGEAGKAEPPEAEGTSGPPMYLAQYDLLRQIPGLQRDIAMPDQVWESEHGVEPMINVWMGSGGGEVVSPAHTDPWDNCYVQVVGHKRVWLAPPATKMEVHDGYMKNTSSIGIFKREQKQRPKQKQKRKREDEPEQEEPPPPAIEGSMEAVLGPGDMLVMPRGWWHAMRGEGDGPVCSVSIWY